MTGLFTFGSGLYFAYQAAVGVPVAPNSPFATTFYLMFVAFVLAAFRVLYNVSANVLELESKLAVSVRTEVEHKQNINDLAVLVREGDLLFNKLVTSEEDLKHWNVEFEDWHTRVNGYLAQHATPAEVAVFQGAATGVQMGNYQPVFGQQHNRQLSLFKAYLDNVKNVLAQARERR